MGLQMDIKKYDQFSLSKYFLKADNIKELDKIHCTNDMFLKSFFQKDGIHIREDDHPYILLPLLTLKLHCLF